MKILITGDLVINQPYSSTQISKEIKSLFAQSDFNIVNLEAPITDSNIKIPKTGPHLKAHKESTFEVMKSLNINLCTLANNHILDYDEHGVLDTLLFCKKNKINTIGSGKNKLEASKIFYLDSEVGSIGIINIAENEWASATETSAGANGMNIIDDVKIIQEAKQQSDFVFVIIHGGHEYYNLPSPRMQKQYRFYVDNGADLVVGHHTHCISGMETYKDKAIYYSLGNFLFTKPSQFENWYKGIVLEVEIKNKNIKSKPIFIKQTKDNYELSLIDGEEYLTINQRFKYFSNVISNSNTLFMKWDEFIKMKTNLYNIHWSPISFIDNKYLKYLLIKLGFTGSKKGKALALNLLRCEAHHDMSKEVLTYIHKGK